MLMPYPIERKLVVGVSSNALFNMEAEDRIFQEKGAEAYRQHQYVHRTKVLEKGLAFPFIRRFLYINKVFRKEVPVEVVLLSKNSSEVGIRIFHSIREYGLDIARAVFTSGASPYKYLPAYNISLFLSTDKTDVLNSINAHYSAGQVIKTRMTDDDNDNELRVAFDFDGVIADDQAERIYEESGELETIHRYEAQNATTAHNPGPLADFFKKLAFFQKLETKRAAQVPGYQRILKTAIVTARSAPAHERAINTLKEWGVAVDELFLLGGIEKKRVLEVLKPHLFLDDQLHHLDTSLVNVPLVHIPFGIRNRAVSK